MVGTQSNFQILAHFYQELCNSCIKSEARTEFSSLFLHIYKNFQLSNWSPLWPTLITYEVGEMGLDNVGPAPSLIFEFWPTSIRIYVSPALNLRPGLNLVAFFYLYTKISSFQTRLLHGLHL